MKKIFGLLTVLLLVFVMVLSFSGRAFAGYEEAVALMATDNVAAEKEFRSALPDLTGEVARNGQILLGVCVYQQARWADALVEFSKAPADDANVQWYLGLTNLNMAKYADAIAAFGKITEPRMAGIANLHIGLALDAQGKTAEAQSCYKKVLVTKGLGEADAAYQTEAFAKINFADMTQEDADALLIKAFRTVTNKQAKDKDGRYIYVDYLAALVSNMSQKAQADFVK